MEETRQEKLIRFFDDLIEHSEGHPDRPKYEGILFRVKRVLDDRDPFVSEAWVKFSPFMATAPGNRYGV